LGVREQVGRTDVHEPIRTRLVAGPTPGLSLVLTRGGYSLKRRQTGAERGENQAVRQCSGMSPTRTPGDHTVRMRVTYDRAADAACIYVTEIPKGGVAASRLVDQAMDRASVHVEFDHQNRLIGIEVIGGSRGLPAETLEAAEQL